MFSKLKFLQILSILSLSCSALFAEIKYEEKLFVPWGESESAPTLNMSQGGPFGPESFAELRDGIVLVNTQRHEIQFFTQNVWTHSKNIDVQFPIDIQFDSNEIDFSILTHDALYKFSNNVSERLWKNPNPRQAISRFSSISGNKPALLINRSNSIVVDNTLSKQLLQEGVLNQQDAAVSIVRASNRHIAIHVNNHLLATLNADNYDWGSAEYLGSSESGNHYILAESIVSQIPLKVHREIIILDLKGITKAKIRVPNNVYSKLSKEFIVNTDGSILEMITSKVGVYIVKWTFSDETIQDIQTSSVPQKFLELYDPNAPLNPEFQPESQSIDEKTDDVLIVEQFPVVTRQQCLSIADTYVDFNFTASSSNLTNGQIIDPDGHPIETPPWVNVGSNVRMPYQWGGFSTPSEFINGMSQNRYAGDKATSAVSYYGEGVDCSGFVCRTWNMPTHYSTYMMVNTTPLITQALDSWYDMQTGDAVHIIGHVRLMVMFNPNGTVLLVEAAARDWRVNYYTYSLSELTSYTPRYYVEMEGMPATISQATLSSIDDFSNPTIHWETQDTSGISGFKLYQNDGLSDEWTTPHSGILPRSQQSYSFEATSPVSQFYRINSVSALDNETESFPSDTYGFLDKNSSDKFLIVDGFDRISGSYAFPYHDFAMKMGQALSRFTYSFITADNASIIDGSINLNEFKAVFWLLGDESTADETLSNTEQLLIQSYLRQGGKLFISGSEIAWDLDYRGSASDKAFSSNFLKLKLNNDDAQSYAASGVSGTAFANMIFHFDNGDYGVYEEDYPDSYLTNGGSSSLLNYTNGQIAALGFTGIFDGGTQTGQVVTLGFPFETIYNIDERNAFTFAVLTYLQLDTSLDIHTFPIYPEDYTLNPVYPNPFNPSTHISFSLNKATSVKLDILDIKGRVHQTLVDGDFPGGPHDVIFNAQHYAAGVYFVRMTSNDHVQTQKILLLK